MRKYGSRFLLSLVVVGIFVGCNEDKNPQKSLLLEVSEESENFYVSDYQVSDNSFENSYQQGNYQALLMGPDGNKLHEITFQKIEGTDAGDNHSEFLVSLPLDENLHRIAIYQLDGRSGHYQRTDEALLIWTVPDSVKKQHKNR